MELLIGCGSRRDKMLLMPGESPEWNNLITLDIVNAHKPDVQWDLNDRPLPFHSDTFDSIRAFEVLEHLGHQGNYKAWFAEWTEWWRILKPGGVFIGTSPAWNSKWAFGDPGHTRIVSAESLVFLDQSEYDRQVGVTPMSDYRDVYKADFQVIHCQYQGETFEYALKAVKPSRCTRLHD